MPLCSICKDIDLSAFIAHGRRSKETASHAGPSRGFRDFLFYDSDDFLETESPVPHYESTGDLMTSAVSCELCRLILHCVNETWAEYQSEADGKYGLLEHDGYFLIPRTGCDGFQVLARDLFQGPRGIFKLLGGVGFSVDDMSPLATVVRGRTVSPSPKSPGALARMKAWIERCQRSNQPQCSTRFTRPPTRILEISSCGTKVLVRQLDDNPAAYATLSHCWGPVKPMSLNRDTAAALISGVETSELPKSFQDAVWLTRELGICYLWIDSLCIYQDDPQDWARESAHMADIYEGARVTLAASRAAGCTEGFLHDRKRPEYVAIPIQAKAYSGTFLAFPIPKKYADGGERCAHLEDEPLSSRGWAFQERHLSQRTLHFGHSQTFFECPATFEAEDSCTVGRGMHVLYNTTGWNGAIEQYTWRQLTFPDDRLPALSGLVRRLLGSSEYLAGLRRDHIVSDLCWELNSHSGSPGQRPLAYRAPTWSWASIDGPISYHHSHFRPHLATVLDAHVDLDTLENPLGKVTGGWLYMQAMRLAPLPLTESPETARFLKFREGDASFEMHIDWDAGNYFLKNSKLFFVPISWSSNLANISQENFIFGPFCLIVTEADHEVQKYKGVRAYQRVASGLATTTEFGSGKAELEQLCEKWTTANENGELEPMVLV